MSVQESTSAYEPKEYSVINVVRVILIHLALLFVFEVGVSWFAFFLFVFSYYLKLFAVSGVFHRYYTHRSYEMGRAMCFFLSIIGCTAGQRGPLSWATVHGKHHQNSDQAEDPHSPVQDGLFHAHLGWFMLKTPLPTSDYYLNKYSDRPEILWLDRNYNIPFMLMIAFLYGLGFWLESAYPGLGTGPWQLIFWAGLGSTVLLLHSTCSLNSFAHVYGKRCHETSDNSRNLWWLYPFLVGENYHNHHHRYPRSANFGIHSKEHDLLFYFLKVLEKLGLVRDVRDSSVRNKSV